MLDLLRPALASAFAALVIIAAVRDATSFTIPNWISLALLAIFPFAAFAFQLPLPQVGLQLGVGLTALVLGMTLFALRWIGGGDAKLFAAAALWLGWPAGLHFLAFTGLAGGALSLVILSLRSVWIRPFTVLGPTWFVRLAEPKEDIPYGVAIAVGALAAFPHSPLIAALPH